MLSANRVTNIGNHTSDTARVAGGRLLALPCPKTKLLAGARNEDAYGITEVRPA